MPGLAMMYSLLSRSRAVNIAQGLATEAVHKLAVRGNCSGEAKVGRERQNRCGRIAHAPAPVARESTHSGSRDERRGHVMHELRRAAHGIGNAMSVGSADTGDNARRMAHRRDGRLGRRGGDGRGVHTCVVRAKAGGQLQDGNPGSVIRPKVGGC